jgi:hypothetical protein
MVRSSVFAILFSVVMLGSCSSYGGDLDAIFTQLKDSGEDFRPQGSVCEQVARLDLERKYSHPDYVVETGISYGQNNQVVGELDVVVFDSRSHAAVLIGEVKCWKKLGSAQHKARQQRLRFQTVLAQHGFHFFSAKHPDQNYQDDQFQASTPFITISQKGGEINGFELTLDYDLDEMQALRQKILDYQNQK